MTIPFLALQAGAAAALFAVLVALGNRLRRLMRVPTGPRLGIAADLTLGCGLAGSGVLILALLGWVNGWVLAGGAVVLLLVGRWRWLGRGIRLCWPALPLLGLLPIALAPPVLFYDALTYHLGLPWHILQDGALLARPENLFAAFPPLAQLLYLPSLAWGMDRVPALLHLAAFGAVAVAVGAMARSLGAGARTANLAALCVPVIPALTIVPAIPAAEGWLLAAVVSATTVALGRPRPGQAFLLGALAGVGLAARMQGLVWFGLLLVLVCLRWRRLGTAVKALAGCLAGSLPWWFKNSILLGEPFAPLGWRREGMEVLWHDGRVMLQLSRPSPAWIIDAVHVLLPHSSYLAPLVLTALLALLRGTRDARIPALGLILISVPAWYATGAQVRFLAPSIMLLLALAAAAATAPPGRLAAVLSLSTTLALGITLTTRKAADLWAPSLPLVPAASLPPRLVVNNPFGAYDEMRSRGVPVRRALLIGDPRGFGVPFPVSVTSQCDVSPLRDPLESSKDPADVMMWLTDHGFSHLVVNSGELHRLQGSYPVAPFRSPSGEATWHALLSMCTAEVSRGGVFLYKIPEKPDSGALSALDKQRVAGFQASIGREH